MLGVGWTEMLVIGVVALIVIGPKELPALMQKLGRFAGTVRRMGSEFQRELNRTTGLDEVRNLRNAITQPLKDTTDAIRREFNTTTASGEVKPSGAIAPADPKAESIVDELHAAAGMKPAAAATPAAEPVKAAAATTGAATFTAIAPSSAAPPPVKPDLGPETKPRRTRPRKADTGVVSTAELAVPPEAPVSKPARKRAAPATGTAVKKAAVKKAAVKTTAGDADAAEVKAKPRSARKTTSGKTT